MGAVTVRVQMLQVGVLRLEGEIGAVDEFRRQQRRQWGDAGVDERDVDAVSGVALAPGVDGLGRSGDLIQRPRVAAKVDVAEGSGIIPPGRCELDRAVWRSRFDVGAGVQQPDGVGRDGGGEPADEVEVVSDRASEAFNEGLGCTGERCCGSGGGEQC